MHITGLFSDAAAPHGRRGGRFWRVLMAATLVATLAACTATRSFNATGPTSSVRPDAGIVFMPPDIQLGELDASGLVETRADWTQAAIAHVTSAIRGEVEGRGGELVLYTAPDEGTPDAALHTQLVKLHGAVGTSVLLHKIGQLPLPGKTGKFDWSLGPDVKALHDHSTADYALFVHIRDSYSSGGRVALKIFAALLGVGVQGGQQIGFASLVDLQTGDVVWFNYLHSTSGDLRTAQGATDSVESLLAGYPM
jgi:hypothetical protein